MKVPGLVPYEQLADEWAESLSPRPSAADIRLSVRALQKLQAATLAGKAPSSRGGYVTMDDGPTQVPIFQVERSYQDLTSQIKPAARETPGEIIKDNTAPIAPPKTPITTYLVIPALLLGAFFLFRRS